MRSVHPPLTSRGRTTSKARRGRLYEGAHARSPDRASAHPGRRSAMALHLLYLSIPPSQWSGAGGTASAMTYAKTHSHAASANISKTSAADRPRGRDARRRGTCVSSASMHAADSCSRTELHRLALDAYSMLRSRAADCPRGHLATAAASAWHRCMLPLLLSCMIGAGGRSNMLGSCAADHPKRRVLVAASASAPTQAAALDLVLGSADPHSPLRPSAADRPRSA